MTLSVASVLRCRRQRNGRRARTTRNAATLRSLLAVWTVLCSAWIVVASSFVLAGGFGRYVPHHPASAVLRSSRACLAVARGGGGTDSADGSEEEEEEEVFYSHDEIDAEPYLELPLDDDDDDSTEEAPPTPAVGLILMDAFSPFHGQYLAAEARRVYGAGVVHVLSGYMITGLVENNGERDEYAAQYVTMRVPDVGSEKAWANNIPFTVLGIICESDSGLPSAERLGVALTLPRHDGTINRGRRDKHVMNEQAQAHGLRTVRQRLCGTLAEAVAFAAHELSVSDRVVVKPTRGVASDGVFSCTTLHEVEEAFRTIHQSPVFGSGGSRLHERVLLQEFARGTEYAVDVVSKNGEHKVAAAWKYDKRPVNGAPFVYHATRLVDAQEDVDTRTACAYAAAALDAVEVRWGLSHVEVIVDDDDGQATLVEVNCRQHNTDFAPLTTVCVGYNALDMLLAAYLGDHGDNDNHVHRDERLDWDALPTLPTVRVHGAIVHLVCHVAGRLVQVRNVDKLEALDSVRNYEIYPAFLREGESVLSKTVDIRTDAGWVHVMNDDPERFEKDYHDIVELMKGMFVVEAIQEEEE